MQLTSLIRQDKLFEDVREALDTQRREEKPLPLSVSGLSGGAADAFLTELIQEQEGICLVLAPDESGVQRITGMLLSCGLKAVAYPKRDLILYEYVASHDTERERLFALHGVLRGDVKVVVTTPATLSGYTIPKERLLCETLSFRVGDVQEMSEVTSKLIQMGYAPAELVEGAGQFATRGGILDLYPNAEEMPYRIEFFGDEVDRICHFDPLTQRTLEGCDSVTLLPAHEVILDDGAKERLRLAILEQLTQTTDPEAKKALKGELSALEGGTELLARDKYLSLIYPECETLLDYLGAPTVLVMGTNELSESLKGAEGTRRESKEELAGRGLLSPVLANWGQSEKEIRGKLGRCPTIHINPFLTGSLREVGGLFGFRARRLPTYQEGLKPLRDDLSALLGQGYVAYLVCENRAGMESTVAYLAEAGVAVAIAREDMVPEDGKAGMAYAVVGSISSGFDLISPRVAVLSLLQDDSPQNRRRIQAKKNRRYAPGQTILSYAELKVGDLVVHEKYGIGIFEGLERLTTDGITKDYITIRYAGTDKLFIPAAQLESVTKYIGANGDHSAVKLSRMGSPAWSKAKSRAKSAAKEMAGQLIALYAARQKLPGLSFPPQEDMETEFGGNFEYELTDPQMAATQEVLADMEKPVPMDRLLCGDVGFGKTEVALRAAFRAIANGHQVAILVPTTILALQHYTTAVARMRGFAVGVDMLSRFQTPKEQKAILRRLARGETDLVIGTHSLLSGNVKFRSLGLLIIDEEQRFGVAQKEKIKEMAKNIDVLTLSATPIPRTLNMAISGIRDMSILDEAPGERRPVQTYVMEYHEDVIKHAIQNELARGGQVLYLYNNTEHIDLIAGRWQEKLPSARIAFAHGQMDKSEVEEIWQSLVRGEVDMLVCTTIIETGVDLPNANTMIIENADRLGLSQLHQLRGRIGRSSRQAYAYFTYRTGKVLSEIAAKRLAAIREYAEFGAGFRIALRDLEIRGAGDLLGASQHGHIETVGYDMYIRLLESAILEEKGETPLPLFESTVEIKLDANIPPRYIPSSSGRMEMYKKISCIVTKEDLTDVLDELCDRYGEPPKETVRLLYVALARAMAAKAHIKLVEQVGKEIRLHTEGLELAVWSELFHKMGGVKTPTAREPYLAVMIPQGVCPARLAAEATSLYYEIKKGMQA